MYVVCTLVPIYDGRDAYRGAAIFPVADLPEVNTLEVAELMAQRLSDEMGGGQPDDLQVVVCQRFSSGQLERLDPAFDTAFADESDDLPF